MTHNPYFKARRYSTLKLNQIFNDTLLLSLSVTAEPVVLL